MKTILIILITSFFWAMGIYIDRNYSAEIKAELREWLAEELAEESAPVQHSDVAPQQVQEKAVSKSVTSQPKPAPKPAPQPQPQPAPAPKVEQPKAPEKDYAALIIGYWEPVEGNTYPLEITKYGTMIQWYIRGDYKSEWRRVQYTLKGKNLNTDYYKCTVDVIEEDGETYLEVYGHEYFAGKYRKR